MDYCLEAESFLFIHRSFFPVWILKSENKWLCFISTWFPLMRNNTEGPWCLVSRVWSMFGCPVFENQVTKGGSVKTLEDICQKILPLKFLQIQNVEDVGLSVFYFNVCSWWITVSSAWKIAIYQMLACVRVHLWVCLCESRWRETPLLFWHCGIRVCTALLKCWFFFFKVWPTFSSLLSSSWEKKYCSTGRSRNT